MTAVDLGAVLDVLRALDERQVPDIALPTDLPQVPDYDSHSP